MASHEVAEGVTDPDVNYGRTGWYDPRRGEIGDITENDPNVLVRSDGYLVQEVAGRNDQLLALPTTTDPGGSMAPTPPPSPTPAPVAAAPTVTLSAGPVAYHGWWYPPTVTLTAVVSGGVPAGGTVQLLYGGRVIGTATVHVVIRSGRGPVPGGLRRPGPVRLISPVRRGRPERPQPEQRRDRLGLTPV